MSSVEGRVSSVEKKRRWREWGIWNVEWQTGSLFCLGAYDYGFSLTLVVWPEEKAFLYGFSFCLARAR